jgi:signal transduction histidine kinase
MGTSREVTDEVVGSIERQKELYARSLRNTTRELESKIEELGLLRGLGQLFERSTRLADVAAHALPLFLQASEAENASIMLFSEKSRELALLAAANRTGGVAYYGPDGYPNRMFGLGEGMAGSCLVELEPLFASEATLDPRFKSEFGRVPVGSLACFPLLVQEKPLGVVNVSHPAAQALDGQRMPIWTILASYLAISISHALLFQQLQESNRLLEGRVRSRTRSLEIANREAQKARAEIDRWNEELQRRVAERTSELENALARLQAQHASLEELTRAKDEFLNNINHEIKTPLNAIIGYAGLLLKETKALLPDEQRLDLELIESNGKHLQQILENIFSLKDIQDGSIELERAPTDLNELIRSAVASVRPRVVEKGMTIAFEPLDVPPFLVDPTLIRRVVFNLLDNAIKFSYEGRITVLTYLGPRDPSHPQDPRPEELGGKPFAVVEVRDQGKGIREEDLERIFRKFEQVETANRKRETGSGVGLAIAKNLVELHRGLIWVTSRPGAGSTFSFCLPLEP